MRTDSTVRISAKCPYTALLKSRSSAPCPPIPSTAGLPLVAAVTRASVSAPADCPVSVTGRTSTMAVLAAWKAAVGGASAACTPGSCPSWAATVPLAPLETMTSIGSSTPVGIPSRPRSSSATR